MSVRQMAGKIIGAEHGHYAMRAMAQCCRSIRLWRDFSAGALVITLNRNINLADHGGDFGQRLPQRLTGLTADGLGEVIFMFPQQKCEFFDDRFTLLNCLP